MSTSPAAQSTAYARRWWVLLVLSASVFLVVVDNLIINVALPTLQRELDAQRARNASLQARNTALAAEVADLREGLEMIEDQARSELGMLRPDEVLVHVTTRR